MPTSAVTTPAAVISAITGTPVSAASGIVGAAATGLETIAAAAVSETSQEFSQLIGSMLTTPTASTNGDATAADTTQAMQPALSTQATQAVQITQIAQITQNAQSVSAAPPTPSTTHTTDKAPATKQTTGDAKSPPDVLAMMLSAKRVVPAATKAEARVAADAAGSPTHVVTDTTEEAGDETGDDAAPRADASVTRLDVYALAYAPLAITQPAAGSAPNTRAATPAENAEATTNIEATSTDTGKRGTATSDKATLQAALAELSAAAKQDTTQVMKDTSAEASQQVSATQDSSASSALQQLAQHSALHHAPRDSGIEQPRYELRAPLGSRDWNNQLGDQLNLMLRNDTHSASLQLTPDNLGPVQVRIEVKNDQATVYFTADHPDTRTALEQSLPRLREMFTAQGMSLTDAGVFGQQAQQRQAAPSRFTQNTAQGESTEQGVESITSVSSRLSSLGMLDAYA